jgi:hypothetical protein
MPAVPYTEKAFLQLMARRLLRYSREAEARNSTYHDLSPFSPLSCGVHAKFRYESAPGGYIPVVLLKRWSQFTPEEREEIAVSLLEGPVKLRANVEGVLEYVRASDAGTSVPG